MNFEIKIILFFCFVVAVFFILPKIINFFLFRKLKDLPEIDRKLHEGEYTGIKALRAEYVIDYYISRGLFFSKYEEDGDEE
jgi:hypothetical protein